MIFTRNPKPNFDFKYSVKDLYRLEKVGHGTFGEVYKYEDNTRMNYAVKIFTYKDDPLHLTTIRELKALKAIKHKNIVELLKIDIEDGKLCCIFPFYQRDLHKITGDFFTAKEKYTNIRGIMRQIIEGTIYMHSKGFIHRDLKTANIMVEEIISEPESPENIKKSFNDVSSINKDWKNAGAKEDKKPICKWLVKIIDFGMARKIAKAMTPTVCTLWYRSPELLANDLNYTEAVDVWSIGCIFLELIIGCPPFKKETEIEQLAFITERCGKNGTSESTFSSHYCNAQSDAIELIEKMLIMDSKKRITLEDALKEEFFSRK